MYEKLSKSSVLSLLFVDVVDIPVIEVMEEGAKAVRSLFCACLLFMLFDALMVDSSSSVGYIEFT